MPANPRWYPAELPDLAQSSSSTSAIEASVKSLQNDARTQAIRQALSRRSAGVISAAQQNSGVIVIGSLMPLTLDPAVRSQPASQTVSAVGTVGYVFGMGGGVIADRTTDKITLSTESVSQLVDRINFGRKQRGGASRLTSGFLLGGGGVDGGGADGRPEIEEFTYATDTSVVLPALSPFNDSGNRNPSGFSGRQNAFFASGAINATSPTWLARLSFDSKTIARLPAQLSPASHNYAANVSTPSLGVIFGDTTWQGAGVYIFSLSTESVSYRVAPEGVAGGDSRQSIGDGTNGWVFGGILANPTWIHRYTISTSTFTKETSNLSAAVVNAATVGSQTFGLLCGGTTGPYHRWNSWFATTGIQTNTKFVFQTGAVSTSTGSLSIARSHPVGLSNFAGSLI